jgi:uncharacterized membrane protein YdjX (TVP38/TMEM64 family)
MPDAAAHPSSVRRLVPLGILVAAGIVFVVIGGHRYLTLSSLAEHRAQLCDLVTRWGAGAAIGYILLYAAVVALSIPGGAILTLAGGFLFGTWLGGGCAVVGATLGAACIFLAARAGLGGLAQRAGPFFTKLKDGFGANAFNYLLVLRLVPLFPFWLVNLVPALAGVGLPTFLLATVIGIMPGTLVYASIGSGLGEVIEQPDPDILFHPSVLGPILALAALALLPVWYKRRQRQSRRWEGC